MPDPAFFPPLSGLDLPGTIAVMIPIVALLIPIIRTLTRHQQQMAEIIHSRQGAPAAELEAIRQELQSLRMQMNQHTIALDDLRSQQQSLPKPPSTVQDRLGTS